MQWERPKHLFARKALTASGWQENVLLGIGEDGIIASVAVGVAQPAGVPAFDLLLPGMANLHSHAFQRAMAGLTERASPSRDDNFWSWREVMYAFLRQLSPEQVEVIAQALYIELLKHGYTAVGEFHYLHNDPDGNPYSNSAELSDRVIAAAQSTGIHITHMPVLYETSNFGGKQANEGQRRFLHTPGSFLRLMEDMAKRYGNNPDVTLGVAPHSLRAAKPESIREVLAALPKLGLKNCPIHIHAAEQVKEVEDCIAWSGKRPVQWLLENMPVDARWCFIHSTHITPEEISGMAKAGVTAGLCPTTEANLGDGIFPAEAYMQAGGKFGIGTDSHVCVNPFEELRLMEYAQRLSQRRRAVLGSSETPSVGRSLYARAAAGGAVLGIRTGSIAKGYRADCMALEADHPLLSGKQGDSLLDTLIFALPQPPVTDVFVAGRRVIAGGRHRLEGECAKQMHQVMAALTD